MRVYPPRKTASLSTGTAAIQLALDENNIAGTERLRHKLRGYSAATLGCTNTICCRTSSTCTHQPGTVRFGSTPASSALDVNCQATTLYDALDRLATR